MLQEAYLAVIPNKEPRNSNYQVMILVSYKRKYSQSVTKESGGMSCVIRYYMGSKL